MLLLAEAFTINDQMANALLQYTGIVSARAKPGAVAVGEPTKDIYRKMAPLHTRLKQFEKAAECLEKVIEREDQEVLKVGLLTKIAGNYKKAENEEACIKATSDAHELMKKISGEHDAPTIRCWLNLAQVYSFFEKDEEAKTIYTDFIALFNSRTGEEGTEDWSQDEKYIKLRDLAQESLDELEGIEGEEGEEEYYDEEDGGEEAQ
uniref:Tetratricopeptide repeat protein n=1 Tax=Favella ehrenbergii TaxID=182087 RepID=A0A7S3HVI4_9SPIT|mmetsp:Transcript_13630/g.17243  ORF Transcript_13630/g.17243 Transcript_13630/m.17243 type:complete len:206 (+) Transcript_13630:2198-2815(+)|eukprot:CAMPEP_0170452476 /NCGR_PEP_ID=MMETSP0123-20130129/1361_1 /TAXON_ID=182087 /ORGANISM="Favella ehrenbergii, Strain Fehren 1" /LENGTH=205 /DNA_ID=CAMNT_0010714493 /DNA_START=2187 /DNA_END=2804 /DNA_ORIENTATION=+